MNNIFKKKKSLFIISDELKRKICHWMIPNSEHCLLSFEEKIMPILKEAGFNINEPIKFAFLEDFSFFNGFCNFKCVGRNSNGEGLIMEFNLHIGYCEKKPAITYKSETESFTYDYVILKDGAHYNLTSYELIDDEVTYKRNYKNEFIYQSSITFNKEASSNIKSNEDNLLNNVTPIDDVYFINVIPSYCKNGILTVTIKPKNSDEEKPFKLKEEKLLQDWLLNQTWPININDFCLKLKWLLYYNYNDVESINVKLEKSSNQYCSELNKIVTDEIEVVDGRLTKYQVTTNKGIYTLSINGDFAYIINLTTSVEPKIKTAIFELVKEDVEYFTDMIRKITKVKKRT